MCFSNLPVEFDDQGNPYLADEAEAVDQPDCGCASGYEEALEDVDPASAYADIVETLPEDVARDLEPPDGAGEPERLRGD